MAWMEDRDEDDDPVYGRLLREELRQARWLRRRWRHMQLPPQPPPPPRPEASPPPSEPTRTSAAQCLIFAIHEGGSSGQNHFKFEGYVVFAQKDQVAFPKVCGLFQRNGLQIMSNDGEYVSLEAGIKNNLVDIIEILVTDGNPEPRAFVENQNRRAVDFLIDRNDIVQYETELFFSDIRTAVDEENAKLVEHLLSYNADIRHRHPKGGTFLHLAVNRGDERLVRLLINKGASLSARRTDDSTALHLAALRGHEEIFRFLLSEGASLDAEMRGSRAGATPLHLAAANGHAGIVKLLLEEGANIDATAFSDTGLGGASPLHMAVEKSHAEIVKLLLQNGANVNAKAFFDKTALLLAVEQGCPSIVESILEHGPDLEDPSNERAYRLALIQSDEKYENITNKLTEYGFAIRPSDIHDKELLHGAIRKNQAEVIRTLLAHGANVNDMYGAGFSKVTPLHTAAQHAKEAVLRLLFQYGADVDAENGQGKTPIYDAVLSPNLIAIKLLLEKNASIRDIPEYLLTACAQSHEDIVSMLLRKGADPNVMNSRQETPLFIAAQNPEIVKDLLCYGAHLDDVARDGRTPLHEACVRNSPEVVEILLKNGADLEAKCSKNRTPIFYAARHWNSDVIKVLGRFGARIDIKDRDQKTPLHLTFDERPNVVANSEAPTENSVETLLNYNLSSPHVAILLKERHKNFKGIHVVFPSTHRDEVEVHLQLQELRRAAHEDRRLVREEIRRAHEELRRAHEDLRQAFGDHRRAHEDRRRRPDEPRRENRCRFNALAACREFFSKLERHAVKMKGASLFFHDSNPEEFPGCPADFVGDCRAEIEKMKSTNIGSTYISFFDVLTRHELQVARYARNEEIVQNLESDECKKKFPIYADILRCQMEKGLLRKDMVEQCILMCDFLFSRHAPLPYDVKERILNYLSKNDLGVLTYTCQLKVAYQSSLYRRIGGEEDRALPRLEVLVA